MSVHTQKLADRVTRTAARLVDHAARHGLGVADLAGARLPWFDVRNQAGEGDEPATVRIFDEIGGSLGTSAKSFAAELDEITAPVIHVRINSPGGALFDGLAIMNTLRAHPARIIVFVDGIAASAASIVAMGGDEVVMMPGSEMMIHDASAVEDGNAADMAKMSTFLDRQSDNIADQYRRKAGGDVAEWRALMLAETWMFAREAVEMGLADRVEDTDEPDDEPPPVDPALTRPHDLARYGYRYAGRRAAPAPARRRAAAPAVPQQHRAAPAGDRPMPVRARLSTDTELRSAAARRVEAASEQATGRAMARRSAPLGVSNARMAGFPAELRAELVERNGQQRYHVFGHASVVERPYEMWDEFGPYMEVIDRHAFDRTLASDPDVAFLVNHRGVTMARTTNGSLTLAMDDVGLAVDAWLNPGRKDVSDLVIAIQDRDITEMSFAFMLEDGGGTWSLDFSQFRVREADINRGDVSTVNYGANPYTDVAARAREVLADLDRLPAGAALAALARLQARSSVDAVAVQLDHVTRVDLGQITAAPVVAEPVRVGRSINLIEAHLLDG